MNKSTVASGGYPPWRVGNLYRASFGTRMRYFLRRLTRKARKVRVEPPQRLSLSREALQRILIQEKKGAK